MKMHCEIKLDAVMLRISTDLGHGKLEMDSLSINAFPLTRKVRS
jgi:hypothetical protein